MRTQHKSTSMYMTKVRGSKGFFVAVVFVKRLLYLLGYTLRALVTSYQLPWKRTRSTKVSSKFQFL